MFHISNELLDKEDCLTTIRFQGLKKDLGFDADELIEPGAEYSIQNPEVLEEMGETVIHFNSTPREANKFLRDMSLRLESNTFQCRVYMSTQESDDDGMILDGVTIGAL